jgi:hypothetical protein
LLTILSWKISISVKDGLDDSSMGCPENVFRDYFVLKLFEAKDKNR